VVMVVGSGPNPIYQFFFQLLRVLVSYIWQIIFLFWDLSFYLPQYLPIRWWDFWSFPLSLGWLANYVGSNTVCISRLDHKMWDSLQLILLWGLLVLWGSRVSTWRSCLVPSALAEVPANDQPQLPEMHQVSFEWICLLSSGHSTRSRDELLLKLRRQYPKVWWLGMISTSELKETWKTFETVSEARTF
jgi:hypothetical protein